MKRSLRLILITPFVIVTFFYLKFSLSDDGCRGVGDLFYTLLLYFLLAVTIPLAFVGILRRQSKTLKVEPLSFSITLVTVCCLFFGRLGEEYIKGHNWLLAQTKSGGAHDSRLLLRHNNTFVISIIHTNFSCNFSGAYQKNGDTIILEKQVIDKSDPVFTTKYYLRDRSLIPVVDRTIEHKNFDTLFFK